ncbi:hypothetical protein [Promicromonospora sp. NPDC050880]|uniref:hypothetical protein n=1 Tax=Promicromonospora sp. NPDC050880 TaxID=3364406 RepID=UPI0037961539
MPADVRIQGVETFNKLAKALKTVDAGKEIRKALLANLRAAAQPVADNMRSALAKALPSRGGASKAFTKKKRTLAVRNRLSDSGEQTAGVRIISTDDKHDYRSLEERGVLRHPKWPGDRPRRDWRWAEQSVPTAGVLERELQAGESELLDGVADAVTEAAAAIERAIEGSV